MLLQELQQDTKFPACTSEQLPPPGQTSSEEEDTADDELSQAASEGKAVQDCSRIEGVAGLLALTSTGDLVRPPGCAERQLNFKQCMIVFGSILSGLLLVHAVQQLMQIKYHGHIHQCTMCQYCGPSSPSTIYTRNKGQLSLLS